MFASSLSCFRGPLSKCSSKVLSLASTTTRQFPVPIIGSTVSSILMDTSATVVSSFEGYNQQQIRHRSNRSRRGLYNGKDIRSGNNVSFSMKKTKRKFKPNVFKKSVYSEILDEMVRFHLTASTLRSIDKAGGLDNYLLTSRYVTEGEGLVAKRRILNRMKLLEKINGEGNVLKKIELNRSTSSKLEESAQT